MMYQTWKQSLSLSFGPRQQQALDVILMKAKSASVPHIRWRVQGFHSKAACSSLIPQLMLEVEM
jgi:hypothetical protein